jgi:hypothetical protein
MSRRLDWSRGRRTKGRLPPFVPITKTMLKESAWIACSHGACRLYLALKVRYNSNLQNGVYLSDRDGAEELGANKDSVNGFSASLGITDSFGCFHPDALALMEWARHRTGD